jgi:hypothetical protein
MDILKKITNILNESDYEIRQAKQKALGLEHIAFDKFKDKQGNIYISDGPNFKKVGHEKEILVPGPYEVVPAKYWKNKVTGSTASVHGAAPYTSDKDKENWEPVDGGWSVYDSRTNTYGTGRRPWKTRKEVVEWVNQSHLNLKIDRDRRMARVEKMAKDQVSQMQSATSEEEVEEIYNQNDRYVKEKIRDLTGIVLYKSGKIDWSKTEFVVVNIRKFEKR